MRDRRSGLWERACCALAALALLCLTSASGEAAAVSAAPRLIRAPIDETALVRLVGNTRPEATARYDAGRLPDSLPLEHMLLQLRRPREREAALEAEIARLHDRRSTHFHHWLSVRQLAEQYGPAAEDVAAVAAWLRSHGFTVNTIYPSRLAIDFSGTAGAVRTAFHTEMHALNVRGRRHIANMSDPAVPAALAPAVAGIVSLNDFRPRPLYRQRAAYTVSSSTHLVAPADLATIYNFNPTFAAGVSGQGQTVVVVEDSDMFSTGNLATFRSTFGLSSYTGGSLTQVHPSPPSGSSNCSDPGATDDEFEAALDVEWSSAAAPSAAIELASCANTKTTPGLFVALENLVNAASPPAILSVSYLSCEALLGAAGNSTLNSIYSQAVALGISVFVAAGDSGGADCDDGESTATHGIGVNGLASTPYDLAAGGTDFGDTYAGTTASYWSATNSAVYGSALSYIAEIPWNSSCAGVLLSTFEGFTTPYGSAGFCNSSAASKDGYITTASGSGGPSGCASGSASTAGVVSGTCQGYAKPSWQSGVTGIPSDGVRDIPDVSLFAANGLWGHYYPVCDSDGAAGFSCSGAPSGWTGAGGTSFVAPILAGVQALINQKVGAAQGNPDAIYYALAADQQASGLNCNSTAGNAVPSGCIFRDVTLGDMTVDCTGSADCYLPSGTYGVLSTSDATDQAAYGAATGWDFATGLGTLNVANLVQNWAAYNNVANLMLSGSDSLTTGGDVAYALKVSNAGPQSATQVTVSAVLPSGFSLVAGSSSAGCTQSGQTVSCPVGSGTLGSGTAASLTIVLAPSGSSAAVTFTASDAQTDLNPAAASLSLNEPASGGGQATDGPLPTWALAVLALALCALAQRRLETLPRRRG